MKYAYLACMDWRGDMKCTEMSRTALASPDINGWRSSAFWHTTVPESECLRCHVHSWHSTCTGILVQFCSNMCDCLWGWGYEATKNSAPMQRFAGPMESHILQHFWLPWISWRPRLKPWWYISDCISIWDLFVSVVNAYLLIGDRNDSG